MTGLISLLLLAALPTAAAPGPDRARPLEPMANWFSADDYPADALRREAEGRTGFRLVIDQRGNVESCAITTTSGDPALDAATCSVLSIRGRFEPARDREGHAVKDTVMSHVRWVLPEERPPTLPFEPTRYVTTIRATPDGEVSCSTNAGEDPNRPPPPGECGMFAGSGVGALMRAGRVEASFTGIVAIVPEGASPPVGGSADYGNRLLDAEALLSIAADGRIATCRSIRFDIHQSAYRGPMPPDLCQSYREGTGPMFEATREPDRARSVRVSMSIYFRGPAGPTP